MANEIPFLRLIKNAVNLYVSYELLGQSDDHISRIYAAVTDFIFGRTDLTAVGLTVRSPMLVAVECLSSYFLSGIKAFFPCPQPVSCLHKISQIFAPS